ncbi:hypothetical protein VDP62_14020 [Xanthomonas campestris pv. campestris]|uniref:hypothetical protein n=1 Tax=Xanthomonas campestris TaxID=339 RepID=UPI0023681917|nr:hypothetical protein [Xanthomonas campestris]MEA0762952.1 hypothetical protein [Xanthomonas campestris pv. campestris]MEB1223837.1 hypothetical protein [Xanthomonas campestris pv. campestris]MEB1244183.1 hypothetical protein [Xanthomonas campestris pv. campestris]MEB1252509.1 hypothetical protein [Xanthomonas campestris pv. campestris]MEB1294051.1 hypothetical protein [Xanthomonas campestris pv. campestris]
MTRLSLLLSAVLVLSPLHAAPSATPGIATASATTPAPAPAHIARPPALDDGWPVGSPAASGWDLAVLAQMSKH